MEWSPLLLPLLELYSACGSGGSALYSHGVSSPDKLEESERAFTEQDGARVRSQSNIIRGSINLVNYASSAVQGSLCLVCCVDDWLFLCHTQVYDSAMKFTKLDQR